MARREGRAEVAARKVCPLPNPLPQTGEGTGILQEAERSIPSASPRLFIRPLLHADVEERNSGRFWSRRAILILPLLHVCVEERVGVRRVRVGEESDSGLC
jgi:hypothetical protein